MERWPQSLRVAAGVCLNSRFPMFVWWGRSLVNIYNDAYVPVLRVLVVDDEEDARELVRLVREHGGAAVTTASSVADALERLEMAAFDVIVSDIGMPGEDGYSLLRRVRARPATRGGTTPALALSAWARADDRVEARRAGFEQHLGQARRARAALVAMVAKLARRRRPSQAGSQQAQP